MSSSNNKNIIPRDCSYQCGTRIYWNTSENAYYEVFNKQKHSCPNRLHNNKAAAGSATINKPNYYNRFQKQPKPKMSNSVELIQGRFEDIQKKYEILSDIVTEYNGKVHGSQSNVMPRDNSISLMVYYEVPEGKREEVKQRFNNSIRNNQINIYQRNLLT
jgi:hypothetical protein